MRFSAANTNQNSTFPPLNMLMLCKANQPLRITYTQTSRVNINMSTTHESTLRQDKIHTSQHSHKPTFICQQSHIIGQQPFQHLQMSTSMSTFTRVSIHMNQY